MTLSIVSFSYILADDYWDHSDTFGENFDFHTIGFYAYKNDTFESIWVDGHCQYVLLRERVDYSAPEVEK